MKRILAALLLLVPPGFQELRAEAPAAFPISIQVNAGEELGELRPIWRMFGADEPNYATMKDGQKLLGELGALRRDDVFFRAHNLLTSGDGTPALKWGSTNIYNEDAKGQPVYDWRLVDGIFDSYRARGVRPYAQLGFMPEALTTGPGPYRHEWRPGLPYPMIMTAWAYPPRDYEKWRELAFQWVKHCVERYGREEVEQWYWEVWNEPNGHYWKSTPEEWYKLHDFAIDGIRRALPTARVGGPHVAGSGGRFMDGFLQHVVSGPNYATGQIGTPTDFLAFHAKGQPTFEEGHVRLGLAEHLRAIAAGFEKIAKVPALREKPIIIGESDPDGCAACQGPQLGYRNTTMYSSYVAASFARKWELARRHHVRLEAALTWAFTFEDQPYFSGQRQLANNGLDLPVMNVFRMFSRMGSRQVAASSSGEVPLEEIIRHGVRSQPDVAALASREGGRLCVLVWHYHDDDLPGPDAEVTLTLQGLPPRSGPARLEHFRIDAEHSNSFQRWKSLGAPSAPDARQYAELEEAGHLARLSPARELEIREGVAELHFRLPRQGVSLLVIE